VEELNRSLFLMINASADPAPGALLLAMIVAKWLMYGVPLLLAALWLWGARTTRSTTLAAVLGIVIALLCNLLIGLVWMHPRPFMIGLGHNFLPHAAESSFPSDHAVVFFALGLAFIGGTLRKAGVLLVLLGLAVGWACISRSTSSAPSRWHS